MGSIFKDQAVKEKIACLTPEDRTDRSSYSYHSTLRKTPTKFRSPPVLGWLLCTMIALRRIWRASCPRTVDSHCRHLGNHHSVKQRLYQNLAFFSCPKRPGHFWGPPRAFYQAVMRLNFEADCSPPYVPWLRTSAVVLTPPICLHAVQLRAALSLRLTCFLKRA